MCFDLHIPNRPRTICYIIQWMRQIHPIENGTWKSQMRKFHVSQPFQVFLLVFLCDLFVLTVYVWLISAGSWTNWPTITHYYDQLATSFTHGQLSLKAKPDPALLALTNPYDPNSRKGIPYPGDISLHKGKFYLVFRPGSSIDSSHCQDGLFQTHRRSISRLRIYLRHMHIAIFHYHQTPTTNSFQNVSLDHSTGNSCERSNLSF